MIVLLCDIMLFAESDPDYSSRVAAHTKQDDLYSGQVHEHDAGAEDLTSLQHETTSAAAST